jgi:hypothetical protein
MMPTVVYHDHKKRELFDGARLLENLTGHALANRRPIGQAEDNARRVVKEVEKWLENRASVTAEDIRRVASEHLRAYDRELAEVYVLHDKNI